MATKINTGFTIIETMLFLGVAGALTIGVLAGSGIAINQQRYRDSVNSLKSFIQQQYSEVTNVVNARDGSEMCTNAVVVESPTGNASQPRGTSDCMMLGRVVTVDPTGKRVTAASVVGYRLPGVPEATSDIVEVRDNYRLGRSTINQDSMEVDWGATIVRPGTTTPMPLSMLILRSPLSGSIMTYVSEGSAADLTSLVVVGNSNRTHNLCINAPAGSFTGSRTAVQISAFATNQGSIQIPPESLRLCD